MHVLTLNRLTNRTTGVYLNEEDNQILIFGHLLAARLQICPFLAFSKTSRVSDVDIRWLEWIREIFRKSWDS